MNKISSEELRMLRNNIRIELVIGELLDLPRKTVAGQLQFICPCCKGLRTGVNPRTNLSRCFQCQRNFNTLDLIMAAEGLSFLDSVERLRAFACNS
jgi:DNA primase